MAFSVKGSDRRWRLKEPVERRTNQTAPGTKTYIFPRGWKAARDRAAHARVAREMAAAGLALRVSD